MADEQTLKKRLGQAGSKGRAPLFLVSQQNLNTYSWRIWRTKFFKNGLETRKLWPSPAPSRFFVCCSIAIRVQRRFVELRWCSYNTLNRLKWTKNEKVRSLENKRDRKRKKKKKKCFCKLKSLFFFLLFFHYSFSFALQRWFLELEVVFS